MMQRPLRKKSVSSGRPSRACAWLGACVLVLVACAAKLPPAYVASRTQAERAYERGDYGRAAKLWADAAQKAPPGREREEARYRQATSLERSGDDASADALYRVLEISPGERSERAAYARAEIAERHVAKSDSFDALRSAILKYPNSGLARGAATRYLAREAELGGAERALAATEALLAQVRSTELEESLLYARARRLEDLERKAAARDAFIELARRFPYPHGAYWDDALLAAARIDQGLGDYQAALTALEQLLSARETSRLNGSYERVSYAEARFLSAEIWRDGLHDPTRARSAFRRVWTDHPTSRLRDDALFEEALTALASGDAGGACDPARLLLRSEPDSRYAACAADLCPTVSSGAKACHAYLQERIARARSRPATARDDHSSSSSR